MVHSFPTRRSSDLFPNRALDLKRCRRHTPCKTVRKGGRAVQRLRPAIGRCLGCYGRRRRHSERGRGSAFRKIPPCGMGRHVHLNSFAMSRSVNAAAGLASPFAQQKARRFCRRAQISFAMGTVDLKIPVHPRKSQTGCITWREDFRRWSCRACCRPWLRTKASGLR